MGGDCSLGWSLSTSSSSSSPGTSSGIITFINWRMGTKMYEGRGSATSKMKEKNPVVMERSSVQVVRQPRMKKKRIQRRQIKARFSRQRPVNSTSQQKKGQGRSQDSNSHKRQEKRLKTCYGSLTGHQTKFPKESRVNHIPPKTANKQGQSNSPGMKEEDKNASSQVCRTENPEPPLMERSRISSTRENQRSKLTAVEKRRYQTVSEYQFIYPGKTMFHCTKENVKQHLRSIYLGPRGQKSLKPPHQPIQMPRYQWEKNQTKWGNTKTDAGCPIGSEFLRSKRPNTIPPGLTSLMYKINKLALVNEMETVSPCTPAGLPHGLQQQHQPPPSKSSLPAADLQRPSSSEEMETSPEEGHLEQESGPDLSLQGTAGNVLKASSTSSTKLRPLSAKDCCGKALSKQSGGEDNQNGDSSKKEDTAESMLGISTSSKGGVTRIQGIDAMPGFHLPASTENMEAPRNACSNAIQFLAEETQREPFRVPHSQPSAREEKISGSLMHCSPGQKRQAYSFETAGSKKYEPVSVDAW